MAPVPSSILRALSLEAIDPSKATLSTSGLGGFTTTGCLRAYVPARHGTSTSKGEASTSQDAREEIEQLYFIKISSDGEGAREMFQGEFESLNAIASAVPGFCPRPLAWGSLDADDNATGVESSGIGSRTKKTWFLATEYLDVSGGNSRVRSAGSEGYAGRPTTLAQRLAKIHSTPAPFMDVDTDVVGGERGWKKRKRMFGFPVATFCGDTKQPNRARESWADFFAEERLMTVLETSEQRNGKDAGLRDLVEKTARVVVPALLRDGHLGHDESGAGNGITPVIVHGDLWSGNVGYGRIVRHDRGGYGQRPDDEDEEPMGAVVYDPSSCYAHNEYELGIMRMFGGSGRNFFEEYHRLVPKTPPTKEYEDRLKLYELYHYLNHHAIFGAGYRSGAVSIMQGLIKRYGNQER